MAVGVGKVQLCNMALFFIGGGRIELLTEASEEAAAANLWYDTSRRQALELFNWNFARRMQTLALHSDAAPVPAWSYRYTVPADMLAPRHILNPSGPTADAVPYELMTNDAGTEMTLVTDMASAKLIYTFDQKSEALFSTLFVMVLTRMLAANMCYSISGKESLAEGQYKKAGETLKLAPAHDANQRVDHAPRDADYIRGRA